MCDLGCGGVSFIGLLVLYERWAGERLVLQRSVPKFRRPGRPISVSAATGGHGIHIWKLCQHLAGMVRGLRLLLGGVCRFFPGRVGGNHERLRPFGWEKCGHGLTCRPRETCGEGFLDDVLQLLGYLVYVWCSFACWVSGAEVLHCVCLPKEANGGLALP